MKNKLIYISEVENILRFLFFWVNCFFKASLITKVTNQSLITSVKNEVDKWH